MAATPKLTPDQVAQVAELVAGYILAQREKYAPGAVPLSAQQRAPLEPFFAREVIDSVPAENTFLHVSWEKGVYPKPGSRVHERFFNNNPC